MPLNIKLLYIGIDYRRAKTLIFGSFVDGCTGIMALDFEYTCFFSLFYVYKVFMRRLLYILDASFLLLVVFYSKDYWRVFFLYSFKNFLKSCCFNSIVLPIDCFFFSGKLSFFSGWSETRCIIIFLAKTCFWYEFNCACFATYCEGLTWSNLLTKF